MEGVGLKKGFGNIEVQTKPGSDFAELLTRTLCDSRPKIPIDGAYLYCQTESNQQALFQTAHFIIENSYVLKVLLLQTGAKSGYPGFGHWRHQLLETGIAQQQIEGVDMGDTPSAQYPHRIGSSCTLCSKKGVCGIVCRCPSISAVKGLYDCCDSSP